MARATTEVKRLFGTQGRDKPRLVVYGIPWISTPVTCGQLEKEVSRPGAKGQRRDG